MAFTKATKRKSKLRCALYGPSGSGKSYSLLRMATGFAAASGEKVAVIDSERGSISKYADKFSFDVDDLDKRNIDEYVERMHNAAGQYGILGIDSASHAWQELLDEVDHIATVKFRGNKFAAWREGTPKQKRFLDTILSFPGHVLLTFRAKTEWALEDEDGKKVPKRIGLTPEARPGSEYEWDMVIRINADHSAVVEKDRTGRFQDKTFVTIDESFGRELHEWLSEGDESRLDVVLAKLKEANLTADALLEALKSRKMVADDVPKLASVEDKTLALVLSKWESVVKALTK